MPTRRTFLSAALAAGTGAALPATASATPRLHRRVPRQSIGIQLYTLRDVMGDDPEPVLSALADIGYRRVELAGTYGRTAAEFARVLRRTGLRATSAHVGIDGDLDRVIADARTLGHTYVVVPWADHATLAGWRAFATRLEAAGEGLR
ncbi:sugar phosphate isomerase/epimerase family protein, partial [Saccharothrix longispora]|uniref:sugar phosphate isomerase/epimerase family protein n=1 Tax=Saccharothrix longispora TaxID=33920 RepID=UPI0028FD5F7A|nr:sugar phosphate isomerase/epimerase [Saccharothrix longispora]